MNTLPAGWKRVPFGEIAETQYGTSEKANEEGLGTPILRMGNLTDSGAFDLQDLKHIEISGSDLERYTVQNGDLLFNRTNSPALVGKMALWKQDESYAYAGYLVRVRVDCNRADPAFISAFFNLPSMKVKLRSRAKPSINMSNISASELLKFSVLLPPLPEQKRIAAILDQAEALRAKRRRSLEVLEKLPHALLAEMLSDSQTTTLPLGQIVEEFRYGTSVKSAAMGFPTLRIPNVINDCIDLDELKLVPVEDPEFSRLQLQDGDILFVRTNGNPNFVGRCAVFDSDVAKRAGADPSLFIFASYLIRARFKHNYMLPQTLQTYLSSAEGRHSLRSRCKTSAGQYNINIDGLSGIPIPLPPLPLQQRFAAQVAAVERLKGSCRASLARLDELFASLQHRAFHGLL